MTADPIAAFEKASGLTMADLEEFGPWTLPQMVAEIKRLRADIATSRRTLKWTKWITSDNYCLAFSGQASYVIARVYCVDGIEWQWENDCDCGYCKTLAEAMTEAEKSIPWLVREIDTIERPEEAK